MDVIDWGAAQRIGELIAGSPPYGGVSASSVEPVARDFAGRVSEYSGLPMPAELPALEAVDRPTWIAANLETMRPLLATLTDRMDDETGRLAGPLLGPLRSASGLLLGAQVGALTGMLSQRVLGQYDLALLDSSVPPRLLLVAPNLAEAARNLGVDRDELVLWVTIHEITHAVQFSGAPWLRDHLGSLLKELVDRLQVSIGGRSEPDDPASSGGARRPRLPDGAELREMLDRARQGQLLRLTLGEDRWRLVEQMQSAMSLIEGHAEHTMDAVGAEVLPSLPRLRAAMNRRRAGRGLPWRVLERLLGLELKLRQYEIGRRFCDEVVREGGPELLALAWRGPDALPSTAELERPAEWVSRVRSDPSGGSLERTHVPPVTS
ncbi:MAG TPA: zinc-dependent metalloprotease [Solirubrobacteraceae bacterium]